LQHSALAAADRHDVLLEQKMYVVTEYGIPHVTEELKPYRLNRLAAIKATWLNCRAFDGVSRYEARPNRPPSFTALQRFLAHTVHNPMTDIEVKWHVAGDCDLSDILTEVEKGLEKDDDIIQQWFGAEDVMKLLRSANTFEEMIDRVRCVCGEFESEPRLREIVEAVLGPREA